MGRIKPAEYAQSRILSDEIRKIWAASGSRGEGSEEVVPLRTSAPTTARDTAEWLRRSTGSSDFSSSVRSAEMKPPDDSGRGSRLRLGYSSRAHEEQAGTRHSTVSVQSGRRAMSAVASNSHSEAIAGHGNIGDIRRFQLHLAMAPGDET
jgi:hypothetical protein